MDRLATVEQLAGLGMGRRDAMRMLTEADRDGYAHSCTGAGTLITVHSLGSSDAYGIEACDAAPPRRWTWGEEAAVAFVLLAGLVLFGFFAWFLAQVMNNPVPG